MTGSLRRERSRAESVTVLLAVTVYRSLSAALASSFGWNIRDLGRPITRASFSCYDFGAPRQKVPVGAAERNVACES